MKKAHKYLFIQFIKLFIVFILAFMIWIILSFEFNAQSMMTGFIFSVIIALFSKPFFYRNDNIIFFRFIYRLDLVMMFILTVIIENYFSAFEIIKLMITGKYDHGIIRVKTKLKSRIARAILANTISLIPGTLSLWMEGNSIYIHWFDIKTTHSIRAGKLIKNRIENLLMKIFG